MGHLRKIPLGEGVATGHHLGMGQALNGASSTTAAGIRTFPADDADFRREVSTTLAELDEDVSVSTAAERAEAYLKARYPDLRVQPAHPLAAHGRGSLIYAYRDGSVLGGEHGDD
jgi:hypothetical protein